MHIKLIALGVVVPGRYVELVRFGVVVSGRCRELFRLLDLELLYFVDLAERELTLRGNRHYLIYEFIPLISLRTMYELSFTGSFLFHFITSGFYVPSFITLYANTNTSF